MKSRWQELFFDDKNEYDGYLWPESALSGELTEKDIDSANKIYAGVNLPPSE